jgi:hypothetical protein
MNPAQNEHVQKLQQRLIGHFETKREEFNKYSEENPKHASVANEIAGLYADLVKVMRG